MYTQKKRVQVIHLHPSMVGALFTVEKIIFPSHVEPGNP